MHPKPRYLVLVVEDNRAEREVLFMALEVWDFKVLAAANGKEALAILEDAPPPAAIILDLHMPVMDGFRFYERLRELTDPDKAATPVIVLSAHPNPAIQGAAAIVRKPYGLQPLIDLVRKHRRVDPAAADHAHTSSKLAK